MPDRHRYDREVGAGLIYIDVLYAQHEEYDHFSTLINPARHAVINLVHAVLITRAGARNRRNIHADAALSYCLVPDKRCGTTTVTQQPRTPFCAITPFQSFIA